ncbi:hypothetical protein [Paracoccus sp. IB05]|uniref:hypothetical protein n=1 Tax=Paracoccus sp. IB05 TaxID=2779367 RepID=UPI0018E70CEE|nr:hypothetical protein [Paracoccus sp. IB05]MBJ2153958.1 hypothetical protein [Paracoccus sp. IB05]
MPAGRLLRASRLQDEFLDVSRQVIQKGFFVLELLEAVLTNPLLKCRNTSPPMSCMAHRERAPDANNAIEPAVQVFTHLLPEFSQKPDRVIVPIVAHRELLSRSIDVEAKKIDANADQMSFADGRGAV